MSIFLFQLSTGWVHVKGVFICAANFQFFGSLCCIFLLKQRPPDYSSLDSNSVDMSQTTNNQDNKSNDASTNQQPSNNQDSNSNNRSTNQETNLSSANEKTQLTKNRSLNTLKLTKTEQKTSDQIWWMVKTLDFWLFGVTFVLGCSIGTVVSGNIGTYLRSFRHEEQLHKIMTIAPWFYLTVKTSFGIISDLLVDRIPRIWFWIVFSTASFIVYALFIFYAEKTVMVHIVAYFSFSLLGIVYISGPVLAAEYFGVIGFPVNFGIILLIQGWFTLLLQFIFGLLYDMNVTDVATHTCYGMQCFFVTSCLLCLLSMVTVTTSVTLCVRRRKVN